MGKNKLYTTRYTLTIKTDAKMKIYIGNVNIASLYDELRTGFEALGHTVVTVEESGNVITNSADFTLTAMLDDALQNFEKKFHTISARQRAEYQEAMRQKIWNSAFSEACSADLAIFIWKSFLPEWQDLPLIKKHGTKVAVCLAGSEARVLALDNIYRAKTGASIAVSACGDMESILRHVRFAELHADVLIGGSAAGLRPMYIPVTTILDTKNIPCHVSNRDVPTVLHAPSNRTTKGTEIWLRIFSELEAEGWKFTVRLLENIPHQTMLNTLQYMDIFCDGLFHGGKMAREAMAAGCAVLSAFGCDGDACLKFWKDDDDILRRRWQVKPGSAEDRFIDEQFPKKAWYFDTSINPCIAVRPDTAKDALRELLRNKALRQSLALRGRGVMEKYCQPESVCQDIIEMACNPDSFRTEALQSYHHSLLYYDCVPTTIEEAIIYNRTTDIVRGCTWYKKKYPPLLRDGLTF